MATLIRLIIADDHALFRDGLKSLLRRQRDMKVVGEVDSADRLSEVLDGTACDVLLLDLQMERWALDVVQKRFAVQTLMEAIRAVADGLVWMPPTLQTEITAQWGSSVSRQLTSREVEIVRHVAIGLRNAEIAERLSITEATVKTHLNNIFEKLELRDRVELTVYALRHGLAAAQDQRRG